MAIHIAQEQVRVVTAVLEARYAEGYRYLDHCGESLVQIRRYNRFYVPSRVDPQSGVLVNEKEEIEMSFDTEKFHIRYRKPFKQSDGEKICKNIGDDGEHLYSIVVSTLKVETTTRIGVRFRFVANADSLEESDKFVSRSSSSPIVDWLQRNAEAELRDATLSYVIEDIESGLRRRIEVGSQIEVEKLAMEYNAKGEATGKPIVYVDIDTYTRPSVGHFEKTSLHFQSCYLKSKMIATGLFQSMLSRMRS